MFLIINIGIFWGLLMLIENRFFIVPSVDPTLAATERQLIEGRDEDVVKEESRMSSEHPSQL